MSRLGYFQQRELENREACRYAYDILAEAEKRRAAGQPLTTLEQMDVQVATILAERYTRSGKKKCSARKPGGQG
jgi:hypothetical protein